MIRKVKGEFCVFSEDGKRKFGCYPTEEGAKKRLKEVEHFKAKGNEAALEVMAGQLDIKYEPPAAPDNAPAELKKILNEVYSSYRKRDPGEEPEKKQRCAAIAWTAVKKKFKQVGDKWIRKSPVQLGYCLEIEGLPFEQTDVQHTYVKSVLSVGKWVHPLTGKVVDITEEKLSRLHANLLKFGAAKIKVPFPSRHSLEPTDNLGWWDPSSAQIKEVDGTKHIVISLTITDTKAQAKVAEGSMEDVSVFWVPKHTIQTGEELEDVILHICATSYPVLNDQPTFKALVKDGLSGEKEVSFLVYKQKVEEENMEILEAVRKALGEDKLGDAELLKKLESLDIKALTEKAKKADEFEKLDLDGLKKQAKELETLKKAESEKLIDSVHKLSAEVGELMTKEELEELDKQPDNVLKLQLKSLGAIAEAKGIKVAATKSDEEKDEKTYLEYAAEVLQKQGFEVKVKGDKLEAKKE